MKVGFIGLGSMGKAMAGNLIAAGHTVVVWNRSAQAADELQARGATLAATAEEAFGGDAVMSMLADDRAVRAVFLDGGLLTKAPAGTIHVNMATISVEFAREFADAHRRHGLRYVAAPVFGRPDVAAAGKLNIVAAGEAAAIDRVQPLLDAIGQKTWRLGDDPSAANVVKVAGNFMIACAIETIAESVALAKGHGVAASDMLGILTSTLFDAPVYKTYGSLIADQRYEPAGFKLTLGLKDVKLALAAAESVHAPLPFGGVLRDAFLEAIAHGDAERDWAALANVALSRAGIPPAREKRSSHAELPGEERKR